MVTMKSLILRNFRPKYFPEGSCIQSNQKPKKVNNIMLDSGEEVVVTIDNEPKTDEIDCVVFTTLKIIIAKENSTKSIYFKDIDFVELPESKIGTTSFNADNRMNINDTAKLHLIDNVIQEIRLVCGGIYLLATLLKNPIIKNIVK